MESPAKYTLAVLDLSTTQSSMGRAEVMVAITAAAATEKDFIFAPEINVGVGIKYRQRSVLIEKTDSYQKNGKVQQAETIR